MTNLARPAAVLGALLCLGAITAMVAQAVAPQSGVLSSDAGLLAFQTLVMLIFPAVTGLILFRQPRNTIGWLLLTPQALLGISIISNYYLAGLAGPPERLPGYWLVLLWFLGVSWIPFIYSLVLLPVFFPTGQPPSRRWWWLVGALLVHGGLFVVATMFTQSFYIEATQQAVPNPIGFITDEQFEVVFQPWVLLLAGLAVFCLAALVVRYRRAGVVERTQIRWLLYACALFIIIYVPQLFIPLETESGEPTAAAVVLNFGFGLALLLIPTAIAVAILRYRLFDIDVIIRRTLVYSVLTAILALAYFGSIIILQNVFQALTGEQQAPLVTVLSTLVIAALFGPLRARIQRVIDQRFYRKKYDAARTLAGFSAQARDEVALEQLSGDLIRVVDDTMRPAHVSLWVRPAQE